VRTVVVEGVIGEPLEITEEVGGPLDSPMESPAYFSRQNTVGGALFDTGIPMVDAVVWLFGDLSDIQYADDAHGGVESNAEVRGRVRMNDRVVPVRLSFSWTDPMRNGIRVRGSKGSAFASTAAPETVMVRQPLI
jgi:predicted dehydrogenase